MKIAKIILPVLALLVSASVRAQETATIQLELPATFFNQVCPAPVWQNLTVAWQGTVDRRPQSSVGLESKKNGKDPIAVNTDPPIADLIDGKLREIFSRCGMHLVADSPEIPVKLGASIEEFYAGVEKGLIFGKGKAKSLIRISAALPNRKVNASMGYELEFKNTKQGSLKRLTATLNEVLLKTLEQVPKSQELRGLAGVF